MPFTGGALLNNAEIRKSSMARLLGGKQPATSSVARRLLFFLVEKPNRRSERVLNHICKREKTMVTNKQTTVLIVANVLLAGICGCGTFPLVGSVLEGTWNLEVSNPLPPLTRVAITFARDGTVSEVSYYLSDAATVTWNDPENEVTVEGDQLHVSVTQFGQGFTFNGTLDSATSPSSASGKLNLDFSFANVDLSVTGGDATLIRQ
jgi:hypothetical protein